MLARGYCSFPFVIKWTWSSGLDGVRGAFFPVGLLLAMFEKAADYAASPVVGAGARGGNVTA